MHVYMNSDHSGAKQFGHQFNADSKVGMTDSSGLPSQGFLVIGGEEPGPWSAGIRSAMAVSVVGECSPTKPSQSETQGDAVPKAS
ncbi:hypothetical protein AG1IA_10489 [Rhizoctonia solani AG-1 IA]|uniref:Uncharacterized protein n=1 Tax=Thanatephorus cucumeris (strain AG1-IA) TaxID=983506 RepID=L8WBE0_THACA|nr:hypothetical protein AG1IA_10489 [Rhizoctonia solani AG-1 IA]